MEFLRTMFLNFGRRLFHSLVYTVNLKASLVKKLVPHS